MIDKEEFSPLLPPGFYPKTLAELRVMCVDAFPLSKTRPAIMGGLEKLIAILVSEKIVGEIWVDGSFLSEKIDPDDVDIVLCVTADFYDGGTVKQKTTLDMVANEDLKRDYRCDSYVHVTRTVQDPLYSYSEWDKAYWIKQFGFSRGNDYKGMVVLGVR